MLSSDQRAKGTEVRGVAIEAADSYPCTVLMFYTPPIFHESYYHYWVNKWIRVSSGSTEFQ